VEACFETCGKEIERFHDEKELIAEVYNFKEDIAEKII
jgi:hypothetical protein